jgi:serine/threonine-protein kinase
MPQQKFGRYEVVAEIGQGAMGRVYKGFDPLTQRHVAIKAIKDEILAQDEKGEYVKRFQREARAAGGLSHPNIITIFDVGENYFVMEYLEGKNLLSILAERGPLSLEETLQIVSPVAGALVYAHSRGVYHRDIKPANIMVFPDNRPVLTDFGLAHLESTVMTTAGQFLGSPSYMSPEQIIGEEITPRADLFSLSVVTYEMLTGQKPFPGENITTVVYRVVHSAPLPPHQLNPALPREYEDIFAVALAKKPEERFPSFSDFVSALNLKEFDRLLLPPSSKRPESEAESTLVSLVPDVAPAEGGEQETMALAAPRVESESSATSRNRTGREKSGGAFGIALGVAAAVALAVGGLVWLSPGPAPLALTVQTDPEGAEVFVDGAAAGVSPLELSPIEEGEHLVRVTKDGFLPLEERFSVSASTPPEPLVLALQPARISLFVESVPPGARVTIDGTEAGRTPLEEVEVEPGQHEVQVEQNGFEVWRSTVVAQAGESVNVVARLRSKAPAPAATAKDPVAPRAGQLVELGPDDKPAKRISGDAPSYPPMARRRGQQGRVTVEFVLTEDGVPTELTVIESAGEILDTAVLESVANWRYEPAEKDGVKVRIKMRVRQTFRLGGS